jgi:AraC-like DNA-binding protein/quercetin dioxygenase-like cupin family protein
MEKSRMHSTEVKLRQPYRLHQPVTINYLHDRETPGPELTLFYAGQESCSPGHSHYGVRDHFLIHLILSGQGRFYLDGNEYKLKAGQGFTLFPGVPAEYIADRKDPWTYCWIGFSGTLAATHLARAGVERVTPIILPKNPDAAQACALELVRLATGEIVGISTGKTIQGHPAATADLLAKSLLYRLFHLLSLGNSQRANTPSVNRIENACRFMRNNHSRPIGMDDVAVYVGVSRKHLSDIFKAATGQSPKEYLTAYRLSVAAELLAASDLPVKAIAHSTGFTDEFYFSKLFHSRYGNSPTHHRARKSDTVGN